MKKTVICCMFCIFFLQRRGVGVTVTLLCIRATSSRSRRVTVTLLCNRATFSRNRRVTVTLLCNRATSSRSIRAWRRWCHRQGVGLRDSAAGSRSCGSDSRPDPWSGTHELSRGQDPKCWTPTRGNQSNWAGRCGPCVAHIGYFINQPVTDHTQCNCKI